MSWDREAEYTTCDDCGDHDPIDEEECIKAGKEHDAKWDEYADYVIETGLDPLDEYYVKHHYTRKVRYTVELSNSLGRAIIRRWKRGTKGAWTGGLPDKTLADYLHCYRSFHPDAVRTKLPLKDLNPTPDRPYGGRVYFTMGELEELAIEDDDCTVTIPRGAKQWPSLHRRVFHIVLEEKVKRAPTAVARELRKLARRKLR